MSAMTAAMTSRRARDARWLSSLRLRLALAIAISVAITGIGASWLALQLARQALATEVHGIATRAAERAVGEIERLDAPLSAQAATETLRGLDAAIGELETLTLVQHGANGAVTVATAGNPPTEAELGFAARAVTEARVISHGVRGHDSRGRTCPPRRRDGGRRGRSCRSSVRVRTPAAGAARRRRFRAATRCRAGRAGRSAGVAARVSARSSSCARRSRA